MEQFVLHVGAFAGTQTTGHHSSGSRREEGRAPAHPEDKPLGAGQGGNDDLGAAGERNRYPRRGEIRDTLYSSADHQQGHQKCSTPVSSDGESATAQAFRKSLAKELRGKFPCQPTSTATIATALDPRFRQLGFLSEENKSRTKAELRRLALGVATAPRDGDGDEPEIAEPPAKKKCNESKLAKLLEDEEPDCNSTTSCLSSDIEAEVLLYTSSRPVPLNADPLEWWSGHYSDYPHLAVLARRFLCIPATSVPAERVFSAAGIIVNKLRCSLQHNNVDALIFLQKNRLQSTRSGIAELPALPVTATEEINKEDVLQEELELDSPDLPCLD